MNKMYDLKKKTAHQCKSLNHIIYIYSRHVDVSENQMHLSKLKHNLSSIFGGGEQGSDWFGSLWSSRAVES